MRRPQQSAVCGLITAAAILPLAVGTPVTVAVAASDPASFASASSQPIPSGGTDAQAALNGLAAVSCSTAGNCTAGGSYSDSVSPNIDYRAMVSRETNGAWGAPTALALPAQAAARTTNQTADIRGMSCTDAGDCVAVGFYGQASGQPGPGFAMHPMYAVEQSGTWQQAQDVPLPSDAQDTGTLASVLDAVSCTSAGNCVAVGNYSTNTLGVFEPLILTETAGTWATRIGPIQLPADAQPGLVTLPGVACTSAGNCTAVGSYTTTGGSTRPMVLTEANGVWNAASALVLPSTTPVTGGALNAIACPSLGVCLAVGDVTDTEGDTLALLAPESSRTWTTPITVPPVSGALPDNGDGYASLESVSCPATDVCAAGGSYADTNTAPAAMGGTTSDFQAMSITQTSGADADSAPWNLPMELSLPADAATAPSSQEAGLIVGCSADGECAGVGSYENVQGGEEPMTTSVTLPVPKSTGSGQGTPPAVKLGTVKVRGSTVAVTVGCAEAGATAPCAGTARLAVTEHYSGQRLVAITAVAKRRTVTVTLASARYLLTPGVTKTLKLLIGPAGRALLAHHRKLPSLLTLTPSGARQTSARVSVTLRGK